MAAGGARASVLLVVAFAPAAARGEQPPLGRSADLSFRGLRESLVGPSRPAPRLPEARPPVVKPYRVQRSAPVTDAIMVANIAIYIAQVASGHSITSRWCKPVGRFRWPEHVPRLISPAFLHASPFHLLVNSHSLSHLGPVVESYFGSARFAATYLVAGAAGVGASFRCSPGVQSVGASGAIFGLLGAYAAFLAQNQGLVAGAWPRLRALAEVTATNIALGFVGTNIDNAGHLGGLVAGLVTGLAVGPRLLRATERSWPFRVVVVDRPLLRFPRRSPVSNPSRPRRPPTHSRPAWQSPFDLLGSLPTHN